MVDFFRLQEGLCNSRGHLKGTVPGVEMGRRLEDLPRQFLCGEWPTEAPEVRMGNLV